MAKWKLTGEFQISGINGNEEKFEYIEFVTLEVEDGVDREKTRAEMVKKLDLDRLAKKHGWTQWGWSGPYYTDEPA